MSFGEFFIEVMIIYIIIFFNFLSVNSNCCLKSLEFTFTFLNIMRMFQFQVLIILINSIKGKCTKNCYIKIVKSFFFHQLINTLLISKFGIRFHAATSNHFPQRMSKHSISPFCHICLCIFLISKRYQQVTLIIYTIKY